MLYNKLFINVYRGKSTAIDLKFKNKPHKCIKNDVSICSHIIYNLSICKKGQKKHFKCKEQKKKTANILSKVTIILIVFLHEFSKICVTKW